MRKTIPACLIVLLATAWCGAAKCQTGDFAKEDQEADKRAEIDYLTARIADEMAELRRCEERYKRRDGSPDDVLGVQIQLKRSQVALAREQRDGPRLLQLLRELVSPLEEQVRRVEKSGKAEATRELPAVARAELADAKAALTEASATQAAREGTGYDRQKVLASLEALIAARQAEIDALRRIRIVDFNYVLITNAAKNRLREAQIRLAEAKGDHTALVGLHAGRVHYLEREFERMQDLYALRSISEELLAAPERRLRQARRELAKAQRQVGGSSDSSDTRAPHSRVP